MKRSQMPMQGMQGAEPTAPQALRDTGPNGDVGATRRDACAVIVELSDDEALLDALSGATAEHGVLLLTAPSADRFIDQLVASGSALALLDATATPEPRTAFITALKREFPNLMILLAGSPALEPVLQPALADGLIHRFVGTPVSIHGLMHEIEAVCELAATHHPAPASTRSGLQAGTAQTADPTVTVVRHPPASATITVQIPARSEPTEEAPSARLAAPRSPLSLASALAAVLAAAGWLLARDAGGP